MQNFDRYPPICNRLPILNIGRYVSAGMITDTDISADIQYRPIPICQPLFSPSGYTDITNMGISSKKALQFGTK